MTKLGQTIGIVRLLKPQHARTFARAVVPEVVRPARVIWNQAIDAVFPLFAASFFGYSATHRENPAGIGFGIFLGVIMTFFGVTSFLRARQIGRR